MSPLETAVERLRRLNCHPVKSGNGYKAFCPIHEADGSGHTPSLTLSRGRKVGVVVKCQAGCDQTALLTVLEIAPESRQNDGKRIVATYSYRDQAGHEIRQKLRYEPKDFRIRHKDAADNWVYKAGGGPAVLYRLPELIGAIARRDAVFVVEGEKDADRLASLGLVATCNIEGAAKPDQRSKWRTEYTAQLSGAARVVLIPDHDEPGRAHMRHAAQQLRGKVGDVRWLELPGLPDKGDASDWLDAGHTLAELRSLAETAAAPPNERASASSEKPAAAARKSFGGAVETLSGDPWKGVIGYNSFRQCIEKRLDTPYNGKPGPWQDHDTAETMLWFEQKRDLEFEAGTVDRAVMTVAHRNAFNPAQDRLRKLVSEWDGTKRLKGWLTDYLNAKATDGNREYLAEIGPAFLKGVVARVLHPGCKRDDVIVIRGDQGWRKSTAAAAISDCIHSEAFTDSVDLSNLAEAKIQIRGVIIAELSELAGMQRGEVETIKAFVATRSDHFREKFGKYASDFPRTVSFIGTTNDPNYLKDPTGNRRWWPVTLDGPIDIDRLRAALPQLIGEAARRVLDGEIWYVVAEKALEQAEAIRAAHFDEDPWTDDVLRIAEGFDTGLVAMEGTLTSVAILDAMQIPKLHQTPGTQRRIAGILRHAGYTEARKRFGKHKNKVRYWKKPLIYVRDMVNPDHLGHRCFEKENDGPDMDRITELSGPRDSIDSSDTGDSSGPSGPDAVHENSIKINCVPDGPDGPGNSLYPLETKNDADDDSKVF